MPEITDEAIKNKHKEFDQRIRSVLNELRGKPKRLDIKGRLKNALEVIKGQT